MWTSPGHAQGLTGGNWSIMSRLLAYPGQISNPRAPGGGNPGDRLINPLSQQSPQHIIAGLHSDPHGVV